jgi:hypothetical protein
VSAEDQVQDQNQQQNAADPHTAPVPVSAVTEAAPNKSKIIRMISIRSIRLLLSDAAFQEGSKLILFFPSPKSAS